MKWRVRAQIDAVSGIESVCVCAGVLAAPGAAQNVQEERRYFYVYLLRFERRPSAREASPHLRHSRHGNLVSPA